MKKIHDDLTAYYYQMRQRSIPIKYTEKQLKLQDEIDGYRFSLPKTTGELRIIGNKMCHCVGIYAERVLQGKCTIIVMIDNAEEYKVCLEVSQDLSFIRQAKCHFNKPVEGELAQIVRKWLAIKNLEDKSYDLVNK